MKKNRLLLSVLCFLLMLLLIPTSVYARTAVNTDHPASLSVVCRYEDRALKGVVFDLYKVADTDSFGRFTLTDAFSGYAVSLEQESSAAWRALAATLEQYALRDGIAAVKQTDTDESGTASFGDIGIGMYLVCGQRYEDGNFVYTPEAFLVSVPGLDENDSWKYDVETACKGEGFTSQPETTTVKVLKVWEDSGHETNRPEEIEVQLLRDGTVYETVVLKAENNWRYTWNDLSTDHVWSVIEKTVPDNYIPLVSREGITFVLSNVYNPTFTEVEVEKIWDDKGYENKRPESIEVQLLRDGEVYDTVVLNSDGKWKHNWDGLEAGRDWTVKEKSAPSGYKSGIKQT
ncbi:MAG: Cna B-type domain-containing protein, partial [Oscillospiraceae bacterium]|nr:Cna B-type domain-containing protein [Oscillospiraceae bacterium]